MRTEEQLLNELSSLNIWHVKFTKSTASPPVHTIVFHDKSNKAVQPDTDLVQDATAYMNGRAVACGANHLNLIVPTLTFQTDDDLNPIKPS